MNVKLTRKAEQSEATRGALLAVARDLFGTRGFADVSTEEIVRSAGVTRGALYHHFRGKEDLFRAVYEELERGMAEKVATAALTETDPLEQQRAGWNAYLDACLDPAVQRVALRDAPSVLGLDTWRAIAAAHGLTLVRAGLESLIQAGLIEEQPVEPLAHLVLGALSEAGMVIAEAEDREAARALVGASLERLLVGLLVPGRRPS
jgi:AcrR family transcriptional regulator